MPYKLFAIYFGMEFIQNLGTISTTHDSFSSFCSFCSFCSFLDFVVGVYFCECRTAAQNSLYFIKCSYVHHWHTIAIWQCIYKDFVRTRVTDGARRNFMYLKLLLMMSRTLEYVYSVDFFVCERGRWKQIWSFVSENPMRQCLLHVCKDSLLCVCRREEFFIVTLEYRELLSLFGVLNHVWMRICTIAFHDSWTRRYTTLHIQLILEILHIFS